ncbi:VanZ family protein [Candidatus Albibeggiatoa sp. nov. NOAA]|uniref:VanZ family protein n=1 Tax=Candidatus Albibeggiatoa sp. nov. NOAA TaxID=3162724 RepID=UPI0033020023|nr:VanZ family protein [Thiotrichaceae bacterium]
MLYFRFLWLIAGWGLITAVSILSLIPPIDTGIQTFSHIDKLEHFFAYFVMMFWFSLLYPTNHGRLMCFIGFLLMGLSVELLQSLTSTRHADGWDMLANSVGVLFAWFISQRYFSKKLAE